MFEMNCAKLRSRSDKTCLGLLTGIKGMKSFKITSVTELKNIDCRKK